MNPTDQFLSIFNFLHNDANLTLKLLKVANASRLLLSGGRENASSPNFYSPAVYYLLDKFADLLKNPYVLYISAIVEDEVSKVDISHIPPRHPDMLMFVLAKTNYPMILYRILQRQPKCYTHL
ncbi:hypothetical protein ACJMK2_007189 [Sinanodonta woodiana]|uniref:Uncharacterized protein n=1 Tax=Sinanodonta woodiana TaxID=1069815 RepID=A0ABD3VI40_SINWO